MNKAGQSITSGETDAVYIVDVVSAPRIFKQVIRKTKHHQVLYRFLSQVVIDTVNLVLMKTTANH